MKPFHTVAVPHKDVLEGRLTMDVFAADLWEVYNNRGPEEYRDPKIFFKKTYETRGLKNLLEIVRKRLNGKGGDAVIQIQTPFGGGKTHSLIALLHSARKWGFNVSVFVGTVFDPTHDTPWAVIERQLEGGNKKLTGKVSPGKEALRKLLSKHKPLLILMDEILEYTTKASGVVVGESNMAAQTLAFMQEITEVASSLEGVCVVLTLPSSLLEHYDENTEKLFQQLQKVSGRVEKIYTPVEEDEISKVIRSRLFSNVDISEVKKIVQEFMDYAGKQSILPVGEEVSSYRDRFIESYPFIPEVIDVLYHRWGSFPTFQRTRGILRLLSLVLYSLKASSNSYITLSDFDLSDQEIRREIIKHTGPEYDSVIASDITSPSSGSKVVDSSLGNSYRGLSIGTRVATCIFLYSFSGSQEKGAYVGEIKRSATTTANPASVVVEALEALKNKLLFLQSQHGKYFFSNIPNLNKVILTKMENIKDDNVLEFEKDAIKSHIKGDKIKVFIWPTQERDIPDTRELKLVILREKDDKLMKNIVESKGDTPRVYVNTMLFICPSDIEKNTLRSSIKRIIAYRQILTDQSLNLSEEQRQEVTGKLKDEENNLTDLIKSCYRVVYTPEKGELATVDVGIPTFGGTKWLDEYLIDQLKVNDKVLDSISPIVIKQKYLLDKDYVNVEQIYETMLKTPGERRVVSREAFYNSILTGVRNGDFGLGELDNGTVVCKYFKEEVLYALNENSVIIDPKICSAQKQLEKTQQIAPVEVKEQFIDVPTITQITTERGKATVRTVNLRFQVPREGFSKMVGLVNFLLSKFNNVEVSIKANEGEITEEDYESKVKETFKQLGIKADEIQED